MEEETKSIILGQHIGEAQEQKLKSIDIALITPNRNQPRKDFDEEKMIELANSIKQYGVLQPIILYKEKDKYVIIAGERRYRACKIANIKKIPCIIKTTNCKKDISAVALIENIQRENLKFTEEATYYNEFIKTHECTQEELSKIIGKSRSSIANIIRINTLPNSIKEKINNNQISLGHAKLLVGKKNPELIAEKIIVKKFTVRQTEEFIKLQKKDLKKEEKEDIKQIEQTLSAYLNSEVKIRDKKIIIELKSLHNLDKIMEKINELK